MKDTMRILIDIGHPGDFYLFKNFANEMQSKGNAIFFTVREGESEILHLKHYGFNHIFIGKKRSSFIGKIFGIFLFSIRIILVSLQFRPTHFLSHGSMFAGIAAFFFRKPHIALEDTGNMEQIRLSRPFSNVILSPDVLPLHLGYKHLRYSGYHELCYLAPKYYSPNKSIYQYLGIKEGTKYVILRFVSWRASHDMNQKGLSFAEKIDLVHFLSKDFIVFISSEKKIEKELESYRINIPVTMMHDALAFAEMYIGEGATMASEAGILGTPSIYISTIKISYNEDQEVFGTVFNFTNYNSAKKKINDLISMVNVKQEFQYRREKLLRSKIDVTAFIVWFVENWPSSFIILKQNPDYQYKFR